MPVREMYLILSALNNSKEYNLELPMLNTADNFTP